MSFVVVVLIWLGGCFCLFVYLFFRRMKAGKKPNKGCNREGCESVWCFPNDAG